MKCFYHKVDLDGQCAGAIIYKRYPECEMIGINYNDKFPWDTIKKNEKVFMVDFTLEPFWKMARLNDMCDLHWMDHHTSALEAARLCNFKVSGGKNCKTLKAGCELTWEYIYPNVPQPKAVHLLGRYDVWDHDNPDVLFFQYGMRCFKDTRPHNSEIWEGLLQIDAKYKQKTNIRVGIIVDRGKLLVTYEHNQNTKIVNSAFETEFAGLRAICLNRNFCSSRVFDSVYDAEKHDIMVVYHQNAHGWKYTIFSTKPEVDCSRIAVNHKGGGHRGAAGFNSEFNLFTNSTKVKVKKRES